MRTAVRSIAETASEQWRFVRNLFDNPRTTGAIAPSGGVMARKMASVADPSSSLPVLEIGPGTGVMTRALVGLGIAQERLWLIEYSADFVRRLRADFPKANVIHGDAFDLDATLGEHRGLTFDSVVSSLPLLSFPLPRRVALVEDLLSRIPAGRPMVQFSYQPFPPVPAGHGNYQVEHFCNVLMNIPPARVWLYRRAAVSRPG
ncbi:MAG: class I SAM-dependent methyltransferase [Rhizobiaceae bacterium]